MKRIIKLLLGMILLPCSVEAVEGIEREVLLQFVETMHVAEKVVREANRESSETVNDTAEYHKLISDVVEISRAVHRHVIEPATKPRDLQPLYLSYKLIPNELEAEKLNQVMRLLDVCRKQAIEAANAASKSGRVSVIYEKLLWDVSELSLALSKVLSKPTRKSRSVDELYLEYKR